MVSFDLEKTYDGVTMDLIWWCVGKKGVPEGHDKIEQDMYWSRKTLVIEQKGETECLQIEVNYTKGQPIVLSC